jgi:hypothetical protein
MTGRAQREAAAEVGKEPLKTKDLNAPKPN